MRKQEIAATTTIVVDIATTTTGTIAFARGGEGHGGAGGHGGGGHGFGHATGRGGFGGRRIAIDRGTIGRVRLDGRRFGGGYFAYGGGYRDPYY